MNKIGLLSITLAFFAGSAYSEENATGAGKIIKEKTEESPHQQPDASVSDATDPVETGVPKDQTQQGAKKKKKKNQARVAKDRKKRERERDAITENLNVQLLPLNKESTTTEAKSNPEELSLQAEQQPKEESTSSSSADESSSELSE